MTSNPYTKGAASELTLLIACVQARLKQAGSPEKIRRILQTGIRWEQIGPLAQLHKVTPILFQALQDHAWSLTPQDMRDQLKAAATKTAMQGMALWSELLRLLESLSAINVPALPLKGPALAALLDNSVSMRQFDDLDLLVRPEHALEARDLLLRNNYKLGSVTHSDDDSALAHNEICEWVFYHQTRWAAVDLHWALLSRYLPFQLPHEIVWQAAGPRTVEGKTLLTMSPHHELLYLCVHGAKHGWARLSWIADVAQFLARVPFDWARFIEEARQLDLELALAHTFLLARSLLDVQLPPEIAQWAEGIRQAPEAAAWAEKRFLAGGQVFVGALELAGFLFRFAPRPSTKARIIGGMFLQPTEAEWRLVRLPPSLYWLYYAVRPVRLMGKLLPSLVRKPSP